MQQQEAEIVAGRGGLLSLYVRICSNTHIWPQYECLILCLSCIKNLEGSDGAPSHLTERCCAYQSLWPSQLLSACICRYWQGRHKAIYLRRLKEADVLLKGYSFSFSGRLCALMRPVSCGSA